MINKTTIKNNTYKNALNKHQERNEVDKQTLQITVIKKKNIMAQKSRIK